MNGERRGEVLTAPTTVSSAVRKVGKAGSITSTAVDGTVPTAKSEAVGHGESLQRQRRQRCQRWWRI